MAKFKDLIIVCLITLLALLAGLKMLRTFAPGLLGIGKDLQVVQLSDAKPAYYENIFRTDEQGPDGYILKDPLILIRAPGLYPDRFGIGPNDILGFRNRNVPNVADVITIGDSQTYGNNAVLEDNWPSHMRRALGGTNPTVYNMSTGGWGAVQYLSTFEKALHFQPKAVVVAFYTGNDSLESSLVARNIKQWQFLLDQDDQAISQIFPVAASSKDSTIVPVGDGDWTVDFGQGVRTTFTPAARSLCNNPEYSHTMLGYAIMAKVAKLIAAKGRAEGVKVFFTIIPTKELAFRKLLEQKKISLREDYSHLIQNEQSNIEKLAGYIKSLSSASYIDLVAPLQNAILTNPGKIYPPNEGHPWPEGYRTIGSEVAKPVASSLSPMLEGTYAVIPQKGFPFDVIDPKTNIAGGVQVFDGNSGKVAYLKVTNGRGSYLKKAPGSTADIPSVAVRDIANQPIASTLVAD